MSRGIAIIVIVSLQLLGIFSIQVVLVRSVGMNATSDSFLAAQSVGALLSGILVSSLQSVWLPRLSAASQNPLTGEEVLSNALGQAVILSILTGCLVIFSSAFWLPKWLSGFSFEQLLLVGDLLVVFIIASVMTVLSSILTLAIRTTGRFLLPELINFGATFFLLGAIVLLIDHVALVVIGCLIIIRATIVFFVQMWVLCWPKITYRKALVDVRAWHLMTPVMLGSSLYKTSPLVDRFWASQAPSGGVTLFTLAQSIMAAGATILERVLCVPLYTRFGKLISANKHEEVRVFYRRGMLRVAAATLFFVALMVTFRDFVEKCLEGLLSITGVAAADLWWLCILSGGYLFGAAAGSLPVAALHALGETKAPVKIGVAFFLISLPLKAAGYILYSLPGLAFALSVYFVLSVLAMSLACERRLYE